MANLIEQLKGLKEIKPRKNWVDAQRELLLSQIQAQSTKKRQSFVINSWFFFKSSLPTGMVRFVARPIGVLTMVSLFVLGTGMLSVNASRLSLPGDFLYPVKLTSEKVGVALTSGEEEKANKYLENAEERVREIEALSVKEDKQDEKSENIKIAADALTVEMKKAQEELEKTIDKPQQSKEVEEAMVESVQALDKKAGELSDKIGLQVEALKYDIDITTALEEASAEVENISVKAIEVVINRIDKIEIEISEKDLVDAIEKKIKNAEDEVQDVQDSLDTAEAVEVDETIVDNEGSDDSTSDETSTEEEGEDEPTSDETSTTEEDTSVQDSKDITVGVEASLTEARDFLNQGDLISAIEIIKESVSLTKSVKDSVGIVAEPTILEDVLESDEEVSSEVVDSEAAAVETVTEEESN
jgi:hypothetical protein